MRTPHVLSGMGGAAPGEVVHNGGAAIRGTGVNEQVAGGGAEHTHSTVVVTPHAYHILGVPTEW